MLKANLKRHEVIEFLKEIYLEPQKSVDVTEVRSKSIDITCKTRQDTIRLYEKWGQIDLVYNIRLYESDNIDVLFGWVQFPLSNKKNQKNSRRNFWQSH